MSIKFTELRVKNFMSVGNREIVFDLAKNNTTLVVGENGCGKSQCYTDAITYVLFNKSFRGINKPGLVNSINGNNCIVEIDFEHGRNEYTVRRGMKPNVFEIYKNGSLLAQDAKAKDYQTMLEKNILGMNFRSFTQIVILGSASFTPFMQLPAAQRREVIEEILEIQVFSTMHSLLKIRIAELRDRKKEAEYQLALVEEKIKMSEQHHQSMVDSLKERNETNKDKIQTCKQAIGDYQKEIDALNKQIEEANAEIADKNAVANKLSEYGKYEDQINSKIRRIESEIEFFENNKECPTCKQGIDEEFKETAIGDRKLSRSELSDGLKMLYDEIESHAIRQKEIGNVVQNITDLSAQIGSATHKISAETEYISKLQSDIADNQDKISEISGDDGMSNGERESLKVEKDDAEKASDDIQKAMSYADVSYKLLKDTGIKTKIIRQYLPLINTLVNKYLTALNFSILFTLDEEFKETIKSRHRDSFSYESFSEGEKARINISLLLTWREIARRKNSAACNLLILDEVFSSALDLDGTGSLMELLNSSNGGKHKSNIVIISHTIPDVSSDREKFDEIIKVTKVNNFSQYTYEYGNS